MVLKNTSLCIDAQGANFHAETVLTRNYAFTPYENLKKDTLQ